jgi:uncharacterized protein HemX
MPVFAAIGTFLGATAAEAVGVGVAATLGAAGLGYGVYSGERAASEQEKANRAGQAQGAQSLLQQERANQQQFDLTQQQLTMQQDQFALQEPTASSAGDILSSPGASTSDNTNIIPGADELLNRYQNVSTWA